MVALLQHYFNIAFLMAKPQDLPAGQNQLYTAIALNFVTYVIALVNLTGIGDAILHAIVDLACTGLFLYIALMLVGHLPRFEQAFGAICGAGAILNLAAIPLLQLTIAQEGDALSSLAVLSRFVLLVWSLSLVGHVLRHTFSLTMIVSIIAAVVYYVLITTVLTWVFPPDSATIVDQISSFVPTMESVVQQLVG